MSFLTCENREFYVQFCEGLCFLLIRRNLILNSNSLHTGKQCDPCSSNPCANGGQCSIIDFQYVCTCTPYFSGKTCQQDVNECDANPSPCKNGGSCINEVGGYRCQCPQEYTGKHCESRYLPCNPSPCLNGGTCIQKGETSYECSCVPGRVITLYLWLRSYVGGWRFIILY